MTFGYWIQKHDYSSEDFSDVTADQAIMAYAAFDWRRELASYDEEAEDRDCPPGIGFHNGYGHGNPEAMLLHICPKDARTVFINFHRRSRKHSRWFGKGSVEDVRYAESVGGALVPDLIRSFFALDQDSILRHCDD